MQNVESITAKRDQWEGTIGPLINDKRMYKQRGDSGRIEIIIYPAGKNAPPAQKKGAKKN